MAYHRFFATGEVPDEGTLPLAPTDVHHLRDVLRLEPGAEVVIAYSGEAQLVRLTAVGVEVSGVRLGPASAPDVPRAVLVQGIGKGEKMDAVVRQATELGVSRVIPLLAERSVVRLDATKAAARTERWRRIAAEAAKQSQRADVPAVDRPVEVSALPGALGGVLVLVCWEDAEGAPGIQAAIEAADPGAADAVAVVIGPEGGLTAREVGLLTDEGATVVSLGPTVLRTETAGVVALALALAAMGGLGYGRG